MEISEFKKGDIVDFPSGKNVTRGMVVSVGKKYLSVVKKDGNSVLVLPRDVAKLLENISYLC